nr:MULTISPECIES: hypothetical protein [Pseudomonas]
MDSVHRTAIRHGDAIAQSTDQRKTRIAKPKSQSEQHSPTVMTEAATRIPSSAYKPEPKSGTPKYRRMDSVRSNAIRQGDAIAQSTDQRQTAHRKNPKPNRATQSRRHDGSRDADSILRIQSGTQIRTTENRRMDSVRSIAIRQDDAIAQSSDQRKTPHRKNPKANPRNTAPPP